MCVSYLNHSLIGSNSSWPPYSSILLILGKFPHSVIISFSYSVFFFYLLIYHSFPILFTRLLLMSFFASSSQVLITHVFAFLQLLPIVSFHSLIHDIYLQFTDSSCPQIHLTHSSYSTVTHYFLISSSCPENHSYILGLLTCHSFYSKLLLI